MFRKLALALVALVGTASAQKTYKTFSVCSGPYNSTASGAVDLFTCNGNAPTSTKVGTYAFNCGSANTGAGQNGLIVCTDDWVINGCEITHIGQYNGDTLAAVTLGTFATTAAAGVKKCPKGSAIKSYATAYYTGAGATTIDKYTFGLQGIGKAPL